MFESTFVTIRNKDLEYCVMQCNQKSNLKFSNERFLHQLMQANVTIFNV